MARIRYEIVVDGEDVDSSLYCWDDKLDQKDGFMDAAQSLFEFVDIELMKNGGGVRKFVVEIETEG